MLFEYFEEILKRNHIRIARKQWSMGSYVYWNEQFQVLFKHEGDVDSEWHWDTYEDAVRDILAKDWRVVA